MIHLQVTAGAPAGFKGPGQELEDRGQKSEERGMNSALRGGTSRRIPAAGVIIEVGEVIERSASGPGISPRFQHPLLFIHTLRPHL